MPAIKTLVVILTLLIVTSLALLGWGMYSKIRDPNFTLFGKRSTPTEVSKSAHFGDVSLPLPAGCRIEDSHVEGNRLYLRTGPAGPCQRVFVLDPASGAIVGSFLTP